MITRPPDWKKNLSPDLLKRALESTELQELVKRAEREYVYWDKFKYYPPPKGFTIEEAWAFLKFSRLSNSERAPVRNKYGKQFAFTQTKTMYQKLSYIDSNTSGFLESKLDKPTEIQKNQLILSGISEEAIASSQIEGANTSRSVAKEMILSQRKPRTRDEQMIINNYQVMQRLMDWKDLELTKDMLLEIQENITNNTLENEKDAGRFRQDSDNIQVVDRLTGIVAFVPPVEKMFTKELDRLIKFANTDEPEDEFLHPVIKASILHFWLAYLHPFVDGNGRTARAIFYWYLLRKNYWLFQYLSVSRAIKMSRSQYDQAYLRVELDDDDLTYFIIYKLKVIENSIEAFISHYKKKLLEFKRNEFLSKQLKDLNERQIALLYSLAKNQGSAVDIKTHKTKNQIAYQTARVDLIKLSEKGLLTQLADNKKYIYVPNNSAIKKLLNQNNYSATIPES
jgi:Fic family protein